MKIPDELLAELGAALGRGGGPTMMRRPPARNNGEPLRFDFGTVPAGGSARVQAHSRRHCWLGSCDARDSICVVGDARAFTVREFSVAGMPVVHMGNQETPLSLEAFCLYLSRGLFAIPMCPVMMNVVLVLVNTSGQDTRVELMIATHSREEG